MTTFYQVEVVAITDGDTVKVRVKLDDDTFRNLTLRLEGIDAPEINAADPEVRAKAWASRQFVADRLVGNKTVQIVTHGSDKYGRRLATVYYNDERRVGHCLNVEMIEQGHARPYPG